MSFETRVTALAQSVAATFNTRKRDYAEVSLNAGTVIYDFNLITERVFFKRTWDTSTAGQFITIVNDTFVIGSELDGRKAKVWAQISIDTAINNRVQGEIEIMQNGTRRSYGANYLARDADIDLGSILCLPREITLAAGDIIDMNTAFEQDGTSGIPNVSIDGGSFMAIEVL